ncbi:hypothetical protein AKJ16_DCAP23759 [Drosera capensis]
MQMLPPQNQPQPTTAGDAYLTPSKIHPETVIENESEDYTYPFAHSCQSVAPASWHSRGNAMLTRFMGYN